MRSDGLLAGRYRLVERLGAGGMSVVWRGHDEVLKRPVAIKVLASKLATDRTFRHRLRTEAQAAARLCHPHIATVYDYGETGWPTDETLPYVVMELIDGESMAVRLAGGDRLPWPVAVTACAQVAAALAAAHSRGVVHRDVTLGNVMLTSAGAKVVDFGISAVAGERDLDADGRLLGTPAYLAPERLNGVAVSPATDVYALGLLLYRSLTGRFPWYAATTTQMLRAHRSVEPAPVPPIAGLPPEVAALCERCLAKHPADRPSSADVARELAAVLRGAPAFDLAAAVRSDDATAAATANTSLLPWATATDAMPTSVWAPIAVAHRLGLRHLRERGFGGGRSGAHGLSRRRTAVVAAGLMLAAGLGWANTAGSPSDTGAGAGTAPSTGDAVSMGLGARPGGCAVEYRLRHDSGSTFSANIAVRNTGAERLESWELSFTLPGGQRLRGGTGGTWRQTGRTMTARAAAGAVLPPGATARLGFSAGYRGTNPLPVAFAVSGTDCDAVVLGTPLSAGTAGGGAVRRDAPGENSGDGHGGGKGKGKGKGGGDDRHD
ncbi:MAG TPA: serine/threonine-protein kinase [Pilimelia sp.]|nr:serine/threonine-protein kinase [Pilimelia sp.]